MPSIFTLEGPNLNLQPRILSTSPLGVTGLSQAAANFWLGIGLGVLGTWAANKYVLRPGTHFKDKLMDRGHAAAAKVRKAIAAKKADDEPDLSHLPMDGARRRKTRRSRR